MDIKIIGDEVLRRVADEVTVFDDQLDQTANEMIETMHKFDGIGLAAPQVGISQRLLVIDVSPLEKNADAMVFVNPVILESWGEKNIEEGCLSIPGVREEINRPEEILLQYYTTEGESKTEKFNGWPARVIQHEIDHLNGVLFTDYLSPVKQKLALSQLSKT